MLNRQTVLHTTLKIKSCTETEVGELGSLLTTLGVAIKDRVDTFPLGGSLVEVGFHLEQNKPVPDLDALNKEVSESFNTKDFTVRVASTESTISIMLNRRR